MPESPARALVETLKRKGDLRDARVEAAFLEVPRHLFLPELTLEQAYADEAVPTKRDSDGTPISSCSQPSMIAIMLEQLQLQPGHNVLEIGAGTGYNAALMQQIVGPAGHVTTIELDPQIAEQASDHLMRAGMSAVNVVPGDGAAGCPPRAAYDRIMATAGIWDVPHPWVRQLKQRGILVAPLWIDAFQVSAAFHARPDGSLISEQNLPCGFIRLRGAAAGPNVQVRVGSSALFLTSSTALHVDGAAIAMLLAEDAADDHLGQALVSVEEWHGFLNFLSLYLAPEYILAGYVIAGEQKPFGLEGQGFAVLTRGSACFVPLRGQGAARYFGGGDALLAVREMLDQWGAAGRPGSDRLRLELTPRERSLILEPARVVNGVRIFPRFDHELRMWIDTEGKGTP
jgi:protein-L-isoaspartate(D-aspartate) O-methyltransferase